MVMMRKDMKDTKDTKKKVMVLMKYLKKIAIYGKVYCF